MSRRRIKSAAGILLFGLLLATMMVPPAVLLIQKKNKFSWQETYRAMAAEDEGWSDLDATVADGLE